LDSNWNYTYFHFIPTFSKVSLRNLENHYTLYTSPSPVFSTPSPFLLALVCPSSV
jgi:hypothetical protein